MKWVEVQCRVPNEASEALGAVILDWPEVQGLAVEGLLSAAPPHPEYGEWFDESLLNTDEVVVRFYLPEPATAAEAMDRTIEALSAVLRAGLPIGHAIETLVCEIIDEESWAGAWKEDYNPMPIGERLLIIPEWETGNVSLDEFPGRLPIRVEPGMAFGTGTHQTTQLCLEKLEEVITPACRVLDVGCGTAILSIAAARLGAQSVRAVDIDPVAVRVASDNLRLNGAEDKVAVVEQNLFEEDAEREAGAYDVILANILRDVVILLLPVIVPRLSAHGRLLASGFVREQADAVRAAFEVHGLTVKERVEKDDWVLLVGEKTV